ncbi:MAG: ribosome-associated translation inhibitor RaiA [Parcubacteria group bacterium]|jgi:ribosomal subunit interface protein
MESPRNVRFLFKDVKIDDDTRHYILKRLEQLDKILDKAMLEEVEIDMDKIGKFRVEVMIETPYSLFRAEETSESIEGSIDMVIDSLRVQITKERDRRKTLLKRGAQSIKKKLVVDESARF